MLHFHLDSKTLQPWTTNTQLKHISKVSEKFGRCGRQNTLWLYLKIWEWDLIFGRAVKAISSPGVRSLCLLPLQIAYHMQNSNCNSPDVWNELKLIQLSRKTVKQKGNPKHIKLCRWNPLFIDTMNCIFNEDAPNDRQINLLWTRADGDFGV